MKVSKKEYAFRLQLGWSEAGFCMNLWGDSKWNIPYTKTAKTNLSMNIPNKITRLSALIFLSLLCLLSKAQEDQNFMNRIRYLEKTDISYQTPNRSGYDCLNAAEHANFVGSAVLSKMVQTIDQEGELLSDQMLIYEQSVHDNWMKPFNRVRIGKDHHEILNPDGTMMYRAESKKSSDSRFSSEEAEKFMQLRLNKSFYEQLRILLETEGFAVTEKGHLLVGASKFQTVIYNAILKTITLVSFDKLGHKISEEATEFVPTKEELFFPAKETKVEWILTDSGCCVRKTTAITRFDMVLQNGSTSPDNGPNDEPIDAKDDYIITVQRDGETFAILSKRYRLKPIEIAVYDLQGHVLIHTKVREGELINLPMQQRAGMYLVHIISANRHKPVIGKIIKPNSGSSL
jgi:hypothetical protein